MALQLVFFLCLLNLASAAAGRKVVAALPGFDGALPFSLETGYVSVDEVNGAELFYYFIQSEGDPRRDPVLLWLTGGDRFTVFSGLVYEIGPVKFIIEPYNGSLPRLRYNPYSWTKAASILFVDSPVGAGFSLSRNPKGYDVGDVSSSLQLVRFLTELLTQGSMAHILYDRCILVSPRPNDDTAKRKILKEETGLGLLKNPPPRPPLNCITYGNYLAYFWANSDVIQDALGIKKGTVEEWVRCHSGDLPYSRDVKSSISGDHDAVIPFLGTQAWVRSLNFSVVANWRAWHLNGQSAGLKITYSNNMTFAIVKGGGHTAPEYQPERCLAMFTRWISNMPL